MPSIVSCEGGLYLIHSELRMAGQTGVEGALPSFPSNLRQGFGLAGHFPSESGLPAETPHGRINGRTPDSVRLGFFQSVA